jgi:hypothetical protein
LTVFRDSMRPNGANAAVSAAVAVSANGPDQLHKPQLRGRGVAYLLLRQEPTQTSVFHDIA